MNDVVYCHVRAPEREFFQPEKISLNLRTRNFNCFFICMVWNSTFMHSPMCLCAFKILGGRNLNCKILYDVVTKLTRPMRWSEWIHWIFIGWNVPHDRTVVHSKQKKTTTVCVCVTPRLEIDQLK